MHFVLAAFQTAMNDVSHNVLLLYYYYNTMLLSRIRWEEGNGTREGLGDGSSPAGSKGSASVGVWERSLRKLKVYVILCL